MSELCAGLAAAVASGGAEPAALAELLPPDSLTELLRMDLTPAAEKTVLDIAIALPYLPGAREVRQRYDPCTHATRPLLRTAFVLVV